MLCISNGGQQCMSCSSTRSNGICEWVIFNLISIDGRGGEIQMCQFGRCRCIWRLLGCDWVEPLSYPVWIRHVRAQWPCRRQSFVCPYGVHGKRMRPQGFYGTVVWDRLSRCDSIVHNDSCSPFWIYPTSDIWDVMNSMRYEHATIG